jgi:hypothetical protein
MSGVVYLVGAGPGAPDLLTLRAAKLLEKADIVFHDALVHPETIALAARAEKIAVGKRCGKHSTAQKFINKRLIDAAKSHAVVVRLKGGDPMLFGRAQEEIAALEAAGVPMMVPGVTGARRERRAGKSLAQRGVGGRAVIRASAKARHRRVGAQRRRSGRRGDLHGTGHAGQSQRPIAAGKSFNADRHCREHFYPLRRRATNSVGIARDRQQVSSGLRDPSVRSFTPLWLPGRNLRRHSTSSHALPPVR